MVNNARLRMPRSSSVNSAGFPFLMLLFNFWENQESDFPKKRLDMYVQFSTSSKSPRSNSLILNGSLNCCPLR